MVEDYIITSTKGAWGLNIQRFEVFWVPTSSYGTVGSPNPDESLAQIRSSWSQSEGVSVAHSEDAHSCLDHKQKSPQPSERCLYHGEE